MAATQYLSKAGLEQLLKSLTATFVKKEDGKGLFSGSYTDLTNKPTKLSEFENDLDLANLDQITQKFLTKDDAASTYVAKTDYDEKIAALEQADTDNLAAAKTYAETKATEAQTAATEAAKTYADATFTTLEAYNAQVATLVKADSDNLATAKQYTDDAVGAITGFDFQIVEQLPETGTKGVIYLVKAGDDANVEDATNEYDEYLWINTQFEHIGSTKMDLTGYLKEVDIDIITNEEIDQACTAAGLTVPTSSPAA